MRISDWSSDVCSSDLSPCGACLLPQKEAWSGLMRFMTVLPSRPDAGGGILTRRMGRAEGGFQRRNWSTHPPGPLRTGYKPIPGLHGDGCRCALRSEKHTSELQSLMRNSYAGFLL